MSVKGPKILIVDDSPTDRYYLTDILDKHGYTVITASDGEEAVAKAKAELPRVVLTDVVMPGLSGFQLTRALRRDPSTADIAVIIISSKDKETDRIWGLRQGASDYMVKPIAADDLLERINRLAQ